MKKTIILLSLAIISWGAFAQHDHSSMSHSDNDHSKMDTKKTESSNAPSSIKIKQSQFVTAIIENYLTLKNALVEDDSEKAASSGSMLLEFFAEFDISAQSNSKQKELGEIIEDAMEQAEHILENNGKIEHQREHFEVLSTDLRDMIIITGTDRSLYQIFCPMFNNNEGGMWLSASSEIRNPYFGSKMLKCGSVQLEIIIQ